MFAAAATCLVNQIENKDLIQEIICDIVIRPISRTAYLATQGG